jgi:hypothetical protein
MKKMFGLFLAAALLFAPLASPAQAEEIDFGKLTCEAFLELDEDATGLLYFWLDGYVSAKSGNTVMNTDGVESDVTELVKQCQANPKATVLKVLGQ